jgi:glycosyltransferase involved in cell wall biosynthesis
MTRTRLALLTLGDPERVTGGYLFHRRLADRASQHNTEVDFVSIPHLPLAWAMMTGPRWLRHPATQRADALVLDSIAAAPAAPWLSLVRTPMLGMVHQPLGGMDSGPLVRWLRAPFDRRAYRRVEPVMVASEWLAEQLAAAGIERSRLLVVPPGKDPGTAADQPSHPDNRASTAKLRGHRRMAALCVANWLPRKGILELLEAVARLPDDRVTLHLVGDTATPGTYARRIRRRLGKPDLSGRVTVHGVVPAANVAAMYRSVDTFVLPSFVEPYGTVWGEAMAAGLPIVGWHAGNLPYLADHEREGLLAPVGDVPALGRALERLALEPDLRRALGRSARERAVERPTWDETADLFFTTVARALRVKR